VTSGTGPAGPGGETAAEPGAVADSARWVDEQRALYEAWLSRGAGVQRRRVKILWWTSAAGQGRDVLGLISRLWAGRRTRPAEEKLYVALYDPADAVGARPFLVVRAWPDSLTEARGRAIATAVGRAEPGGAVVIETSRGPVVPAEAPGLPGDDAPSWTEVDAPG
jgi:hypothetical protein